MRKFISTIFLLIFFIFPNKVFADEFKSIKIQADIDEYGVGHVSEIWNIKEENTDYTERYKLINNLRGIHIEDFSLSAFGREFIQIKPWDTDLSFEKKAYHYGTIPKDDGIELCWGISNYGDNNYKLKYKINPLVIGLNDSDMVFFKFVGENFDPKPQEVSIKISGFKKFSSDIKMWGFGLLGNIENQNGDIFLKSDGDIDYVTIMLKFPKGYFNTSYKEDKSFKEYADKAIKNSKWEENEGKAYTPPMPLWAKILIGLGAILGFSGLVAVIREGVLYYDEKNISNKKDLIAPHKLDKSYYKNLPYDSFIEDISFFINMISKEDILDTYISAFMIKWGIDKNISLENNESNDSKNLKIKIIKKPQNMGEFENVIFSIFSEVSKYKQDMYFTSKDFEKYILNNEDNLDDLYEILENHSINSLKENGFLEDYYYDKSFMSTKVRANELKVTKKGIQLYENLIKFRNYLADFKNIEDKEILDPKNIRDFLIYSQILGEGEDFIKFIKYHPQRENLFVYNYHIFGAGNFSKSIRQSYSKSSGFSSSGFGGSTSFSGGSGSFGGGGGGGR